MVDLDDNRSVFRVRGAGTCASLLVLAGCSAPRLVHPVVNVTPPFAPAAGAPAPAARTAGVVADTAAARTHRQHDARRFEIGSSRSDAASAEPAPVTVTDAGRLHVHVDPLTAWGTHDAQDPERAQQQQAPDDARWSDFLPVGRAAVLAAGYELPRAFGFGVAYTRLQRDIEVNEVSVGIDGAPPETVGFLSIEADSVVDNVMGRLDAWIFPFWNVSLLGGWTWNESDSEVTVTVPFPINPRDVTFLVPTHQDGPTLGYGTNLAAGHGEWFISGDATWIFADMQNFAVIEGFLGSIRSGWNGKVDGKPVRLWGGVTYWDTATTIEGDVATADGSVHFAVEQGPVTPYSLQIGGSLDLGRAYGVMFEGHLLDDVRMIVLSAALRF